MIPHRPGVDSTMALLRRGYPFISENCDLLGSDAFRTRLLGRPVVCARGPDAARAFYTPGRFTRRDAMPGSVLHLLQDLGSVQTLDGAEHRHRKEMFLRAVPQDDNPDLVGEFRRQWALAVNRWTGRPRIVLLREMEEVLTRTATRWAGVPLSDRDIAARTAELAAMVNYAGSAGPANWWARALRRRGERWAARCVRAARSGSLACRAGSPLAVIAAHRDLDGRPLDPAIAAVELLNVLRPVVAVARYVVFTALALLSHPPWGRRFGEDDDVGDGGIGSGTVTGSGGRGAVIGPGTGTGGSASADDVTAFVQEVRRLYPFFPLIGGRALEPFGWSGHDFAAGDWFVLDLYGTNHDPRSWPDPEEFRPERFRDWQGDPYTLVPQGGGDVATGHRCPGEDATIGLMAESVRWLTARMRYRVPVQDLSVDLRRMPALPRDGFVIADVRRR